MEGDHAVFKCSNCGPLPLDHFHPSARTRFIHRCKQCTKAKNAEYFQIAKSTTLKEWRTRRRVSGGLKLSRLALADIFEAHGRRCFITGLTGPLTLLHADPGQEFSAANAVPVLAKLAKLPHLPEDALGRWRRLRASRPSLCVALNATGHSVDPPSHTRTQAVQSDTSTDQDKTTLLGAACFVRKGM